MVSSIEYYSVINNQLTFTRESPASLVGYGSLAVANLNLSPAGNQEIIMGSAYDSAYKIQSGIFIYNPDFTDYGTANPYFEVSGLNFDCHPVVADINGDGVPEIVVTGMNTSTNACYVYILKNTYSSQNPCLTGWSDNSHEIAASTVNPAYGYYIPYVSVADLNRDGKPEIVTASNNVIKIWNSNGSLMTDITVPDFVPVNAPILANIDKDSDLEIIVASNNNKIVAYKSDGSQVIGFPLQTSLGISTGIAVGDVNNDGYNEIIALAGNMVLSGKHTEFLNRENGTCQDIIHATRLQFLPPF